MSTGKSDSFCNTFVKHSDPSVLVRIAQLVEERYGWDVEIMQEKGHTFAPYMLFVSEKDLTPEQRRMVLQGETVPEVRVVVDEVLYG